MSSYWDDWFKRFRERRGFFFPEIDRMMEDMEKFMSDAFKEMEDSVPRDMVRVRRLPDGSVKREYGPFVYGYSVKIGPDGRPIIREFGNIKPGLGGEGHVPPQPPGAEGAPRRHRRGGRERQDHSGASPASPRMT